MYDELNYVFCNTLKLFLKTAFGMNRVSQETLQTYMKWTYKFDQP